MAVRAARPFVIVTALLLLLGSVALWRSRQITRLEPGRATRRTLAPGGLHAYRIRLHSGDYLSLVVEQRGVDVVARLFGPSGGAIVEVDSPNGSRGPEPVEIVAADSGLYRLEIRANAPEASGEYAAAVEAVRPATAGDRSRVAARAAFFSGETLRAGEEASLRKSLDAYREAARIWRSLGAQEEAAEAIRRMAQVHLQLRDPQAAVRLLDGALSWVERQDGRARDLNVLGDAYEALGEPDKAEAAYLQALDLPMAGLEARALTLNNLGVLHQRLGRLQSAVDDFERSLEGWQALKNEAREATLLHNLGAAYTSLDRLDEAETALNRALEIRRRRKNESGQASTLTALGWTFHWAARPDDALKCYDEASRLWRNNATGQMGTLDRRGTTLREQNRLSEALEAYEQALALARRHEVGGAIQQAHILANVGGVRRRRGELQLAIQAYDEAIPVLRRFGDVEGEAYLHMEYGLAEWDRHRPEEAEAHFERSLRLVESSWSAIESARLRLSYLASRQEYYEAYIDFLMQRDEKEPGHGYGARAFTINEQRRARELLESMAWAGADDAPAGLRERQRNVRARLNAKEYQRRRHLERGASEEELAAAAREVQDLLREEDDVKRLIRHRGERRRKEPRPLTTAAIQRQVLDDQTLLLEYSLGRRQSFLWLVSSRSLVARRLAGRAEIELWARQVHRHLSSSDRSLDRRLGAFASERLSQLVLGPVGSRLNARRLVIVADGVLQYVPFAALPLPAPEGGSIATGRPPALLQEHEIVHLPSASLLPMLPDLRRPRRPAGPTIAILADPVFQRTDDRLGIEASLRPIPSASPFAGRRSDLERSARDLGRGTDDFGRLRDTQAEADAISRLAGPGRAVSLVGFDATRERVLGGGLNSYRILHFATHGLLDAEHPELSGIVLSRFDAQGRDRDGFLRLHEIEGLRLSAELVVLSACETGLGQEVRGEGLIGLPRGFFVAGARRVLVSLWKVSDPATAELMQLFYHGMLREGLPPAQALRAAQLSLQQSPAWEAPYYWAGFALQGDWR